MVSSSSSGRSVRRVHRLIAFSGMLLAALILIAIASLEARAGNRPECNSSCGGSGQNACSVFDCVPSCDKFLREFLESCGFLCTESICRSSGCGSANQRACIPFVDHGWPDVCRPGNFNDGGTCRDLDDDGYPHACGGLNETPCNLALQTQIGINSCKPSLEEDFGANSCRDLCGGHGLPACAGGCDAGLSLRLDDIIDSFAVCGKAPVDYGEDDGDEPAPGASRWVIFIHGRGNDLTTDSYDADEPLLNDLAASSNVVDVYGIDWNNQSGSAARRVQLKRLELSSGAPIWSLKGSYGRRAINANDFTITDVAQAIAQAIEDRDLSGPITILTHSFGGVIARELVYRHYDHLRADGYQIADVVTIKGPHRGGLIGTSDKTAPDLLVGTTTGLALQTDFACVTGRVAGLLGYGAGQDGCQLGRWVQWAQGKAPFGIDDTSYPQIRWVAVAGGGHRFDPQAIDIVLGAGLLLDDRLETMLEEELDPGFTPFLDSDETVATRSAFGIALDACYPYVQAFAPGSAATGATVVFDTKTWAGDSSKSATCYHAAATTGPMPPPRPASDHDMSSDDDEREFVFDAITTEAPEPGIGVGGVVGSILLAALARRRRS